jgi:hypothetical protein
MAAGHIVLVISSLGGGGAERVIVDIAGYLGANGRRVTLLTLDGESRDAYAVPSGVDRARINIMWPSANVLESVASTFRRLALIRRAVLHLKPDVVVSFTDMNNVRVLAACWRRVSRHRFRALRSHPAPDRPFVEARASPDLSDRRRNRASNRAGRAVVRQVAGGEPRYGHSQRSAHIAFPGP